MEGSRDVEIPRQARRWQHSLWLGEIDIGGSSATLAVQIQVGGPEGFWVSGFSFHRMLSDLYRFSGFRG